MSHAPHGLQRSRGQPRLGRDEFGEPAKRCAAAEERADVLLLAPWPGGT
ncbi:hypothetical protein [Streptomyces sp. NBC_01285]|nr:hypothetical protein [Streptomyces sp. NBC_01285]